MRKTVTPSVAACRETAANFSISFQMAALCRDAAAPKSVRSINFIGISQFHWLTPRVSQQRNNALMAGSLLLVIFLWGGNNA